LATITEDGIESIWGNFSYLLSQFKRIENNTLIFEDGDRCAYYNKEKSSKIILECGNEEKIDFHRKAAACEYEFKYKTRYGCNYYGLLEIKNSISLFLKEI
jgi:hypothetical protein